MPLSDYFDRMKRICVEAGQRDWPLKKYFRSGLASLKEYSAEYDSILDDGNPFYQEFTHCLQQESIDDDDWFGLFECVVIFIRMRQANGTHLSQPEQAVLHYFETCGEWNPHDDTMGKSTATFFAARIFTQASSSSG